MNRLNRKVSGDECERMRELSANGCSLNEIASKVGWSRSTVSVHLKGECHHSGPEVCPQCEEQVDVLAHHLIREHLG